VDLKQWISWLWISAVDLMVDRSAGAA
jgi:hypothetical protein